MEAQQQNVMTSGAAAAAEFRAIIRDIRVSYHRGAMQYDSIPIKARRSVTRRFTEERFYCAALFQFHSNANDLNHNNWLTLGVGDIEKRELPKDEGCPVGRKWFASLFEAETLLQDFVRANYPHDMLQRLRALAKHAQKSLVQAQDWLRAILLVEHETDEHSVQAVIEGWNILVTDVKEARLSPAVAAINANVYMSTRPEIVSERFNTPSLAKRSWFEYDMQLPQ